MVSDSKRHKTFFKQNYNDYVTLETDCFFKGGFYLHQENNMTVKRLTLHLLGLLFLALGVSFSIQADLGVSPVSSLAYAFSLITSFSVGIMTVIANLIFIILQVIFSKRFDLKDAIMQLMITFIFGFFIDASLYILQLFPTPDTLQMRWIFLIISFVIILVGLLGCFNSKLTLMPYDQLTRVISEAFQINLSKAKIYGDLTSVMLAGIICLIFIQSLGSVGIGTIVSAYAVGKTLGWLSKHFQKHIIAWVHSEQKRINKKPQTSPLLKEKTSQLPS